jgi:hypothetical protein
MTAAPSKTIVLKLIRFPTHSPLPIAALPSMSLTRQLHSLFRADAAKRQS